MNTPTTIVVREIKGCKVPWLRFHAGRTEMVVPKSFGSKVPVFRLLGWGDNEERAMKMAELMEKRNRKDENVNRDNGKGLETR